jgi:hypothetical protein
MFRQFKIACYQGRVRSYFDRELMDEFHSFTGDLKPMKGHTDDMLDSFVMASKDWLVDKRVSGYKSFSIKNKGGINGWKPSIKRI